VLACWVNGIPVAPQRPAISVFDRGLLLADGAFETMRAARGVVLHLDAHLARLADALDRLAIPWPPHLDATVSNAARSLRIKGADAVVRLTVTRGIGSGFAPVAGAEPTSVLVIQPLPPVPSELATRGLSAVIVSGRRSDDGATVGLKTLSYTDHVMALLEARRRGADDAIVLDTHGHVAEGSASNLFIVLRGAIRTPPLSCGVLPGITRAHVMAIAAGWGAGWGAGGGGGGGGPVQEGVVVPSDLGVVEEVFLTSSLRGIAPVAMIDGVAVGAGVPGPVTRRVRAAYARLVEDEVADNLASALPGGAPFA
jgi:branched-chain amino acid aminotransferase